MSLYSPFLRTDQEGVDGTFNDPKNIRKEDLMISYINPNRDKVDFQK